MCDNAAIKRCPAQYRKKKKNVVIWFVVRMQGLEIPIPRPRPQLISGVTVQGPTNTEGLYCMMQLCLVFFAVTNLLFILKMQGIEGT